MNTSFSDDPFEFERKRLSPDDRQAPPILAEVLEILPRFKANILTVSGERFNNVRYFGPSIDSSSNAGHGRFGALSVGQLVLVEFIGGSFRAPIITQSFSFPTKDSELANVGNFWNHFDFIDTETDIIDFHKSGYLVRQTDNKIQVYDNSLAVVFELNFQEKKAKFNLDVEITGNLRIRGNLNLNGDEDVTGKIHASETIESDADLKVGDLAFTGHGHEYSPGPLPPARTGNAEI